MDAGGGAEARIDTFAGSHMLIGVMVLAERLWWL